MVFKLDKVNRQFNGALDVIAKLSRQYNWRSYLVGGIVRDLILKQDIFDLDIVVEGDAIVLAKEFAAHFRRQFRRHRVFGTATVNFNPSQKSSGFSPRDECSFEISVQEVAADFSPRGSTYHHIDFATARREFYPRWGALPKVLPSTIREDLLRRDFTINAMAISLNSDDHGKLIDFYNGFSDLKKRSLVVLHDKSFLDDPRRILRAIRFEQRFSFKLKPTTLRLMQEAISHKALSFVHPHRLRDELILILKEPRPSRLIKRIDALLGFSFLDSAIKLTPRKHLLFMEIEKAIHIYQKRFRGHRTLDVWLIYFMGLSLNISRERLTNLLERFGFKRGERMRVLSVKENIHKMGRLAMKRKPHYIWRTLSPLSFEAILLFYAYYHNSRLRRNIEYFFGHLLGVRLTINGDDLKMLGVKPLSLYSRILQRVLWAKLDRGLTGKEEELAEARRIFVKLSRTQMGVDMCVRRQMTERI